MTAVMGFVAAIGLAALAIGSGVARQADLLLINTSASAPRGLYVRFAAPPAPGARVALRQPATARPYLADLGVGPDMPLLKRVAAVAGEPICVRDGRLTWPRGAAMALDHDRRGTRLTRWQGCRALGPGEVLVIGDTPTSFDSRYFGPVRRGDLIGVYREIATW